jgi:hypothetical protein
LFLPIFGEHCECTPDFIWVSEMSKWRERDSLIGKSLSDCVEKITKPELCGFFFFFFFFLLPLKILSNNCTVSILHCICFGDPAYESHVILTLETIFLDSFFFFFFLVFQDRVFLYSPGCPGTHSVDQVGLELRNPLASLSQVLVLKACASTAWLSSRILDGYFCGESSLL